jgi:acetyl esterase
MRAACALPAPAQRVLFGRPPTIDGETLSGEMQAVLRLSELAGGGALMAGLSPAEGRAGALEGSAIMAGPPLPLQAVTDLELPGPAGALAARFYEPPGIGIETRPLVVYFHGGGWVIGDLDTHDSACRVIAANAEVTVLSLAYRCAPEDPFPAAVDDALAGFRWAVEQSGRLGVDPARIAVAGDSAGGNLAAAVALLSREDERPPAMQALAYPVTDVSARHPSRDRFAAGYLLTSGDMDSFEDHYLPAGVDRADPRVSVLRAPDLAGLAPAYVATAGFDPLRDEGEAYATRMREAGVRVALRRHPGLIHSFANMTAISPAAHAAMLELCAAIRMGLA